MFWCKPSHSVKVILLRVRSHERQNELIPVWGLKTSSVHMEFHFGCISKRPDVLIAAISGGVYMIFYNPKWSFISIKMIDMKSIPAISFKRTCALNGTFNESALIHFVSGELFSHENLIPVWNFIAVKMTDIKSIPFWVSFRLNSCELK